jgi:hypothetical protein
MKRAEIKHLQRPAGSHNPRETEDQGAQPVIVNLRHARDVKDDVHNPCFRQRDYSSTQGRFRIAYYQVSSQIKNPNPFLLALMKLEINGCSQKRLFLILTSTVSVTSAFLGKSNLLSVFFTARIPSHETLGVCWRLRSSRSTS